MRKLKRKKEIQSPGKVLQVVEIKRSSQIQGKQEREVCGEEIVQDWKFICLDRQHWEAKVSMIWEQSIVSFAGTSRYFSRYFGRKAADKHLVI